MLSKTGIPVGITGKGNPVILNPLSDVFKPMAVYHRRAKTLLAGLAEFKSTNVMPTVNVITLTDGNANVGLLTQQSKMWLDQNIIYVYSDSKQLPHIEFACILGPAQIVLYHGHIKYDLQV